MAFSCRRDSVHNCNQKRTRIIFFSCLTRRDVVGKKLIKVLKRVLINGCNYPKEGLCQSLRYIQSVHLKLSKFSFAFKKAASKAHYFKIFTGRERKSALTVILSWI